MKQRRHPNSSAGSQVASMLLLIVLVSSLLLSRCSADDSSNLRRTATMTANNNDNGINYDAAASSLVGTYSQKYNEEKKLLSFSSSATERRTLVSFRDWVICFFILSFLVFSNHRRARVMWYLSGDERESFCRGVLQRVKRSKRGSVNPRTLNWQALWGWLTREQQKQPKQHLLPNLAKPKLHPWPLPHLLHLVKVLSPVKPQVNPVHQAVLSLQALLLNLENLTKLPRQPRLPRLLRLATDYVLRLVFRHDVNTFLSLFTLFAHCCFDRVSNNELLLVFSFWYTSLLYLEKTLLYHLDKHVIPSFPTMNATRTAEWSLGNCDLFGPRAPQCIKQPLSTKCSSGGSTSTFLLYSRLAALQSARLFGLPAFWKKYDWLE